VDTKTAGAPAVADLSDDIETSAAGPKKVATDGVSTEEHALKDLIEADRYLAGPPRPPADPTAAACT